MLAWACIKGANKISLEERNTPVPSDHQIAVKVMASGLNRADILQRKGFYPAPKWASPDILGLEYAGVVSKIGKKVTRWSIGDRVMGLVGGGAMAQTLVTDEDEALLIPDKLNFNEAAAIPEAQLTAFDALERLGLKPGQSILIHAIGSGVGEALLEQSLMRELVVWGTSRNQWKLDRAKKNGLVHAILSTDGDFDTHLGGARFNGIIDFIGAAYMVQNVNALAPQGRILVLGLMGGVKANLDLGRLLRIRGSILSATMRSRMKSERIELLNQFQSQDPDDLARCMRPPQLDDVFGYTQLEQAHSKMIANKNYGKIILDWTRSI